MKITSALIWCITSLFVGLSQSFALNVTIEWDPNTESDLHHYVLYWGASSGIYSQNEIIPKESKPQSAPDKPYPPSFTGTATVTNSSKPTWQWESGGDGNGTFRYKLDDSDLTSGATQTIDTSYTPDTELSEGSHILYVEELNDYGNWSDSGRFPIVIDTDLLEQQVYFFAVTAVDDEPLESDYSNEVCHQPVTTDEDTTVNIILAGSSSLIYTALTQPLHGSLSGTGRDQIYTPAPDYHGPDSFKFKANDGQADIYICTVSIAVNAVNDPPVALDDTVTATEDTPLVITATGLLANDTDIEGDSLSITGFTQPAFGTVADNQDGTYRYTPEADFNGNDAFGYTVSDGNGGTHAATVSIAVNAVNDPPVAAADAYRVDEDTALNIAAPGVLANDNDQDGDGLTAVLDTLPGHGLLTLNADGSFDYRPNADFSATDSFTYHTSDGTAGSNPVTVTITLNALNDPPTIAGTIPDQTKDEDAAAWTLDLTAFESDVEDSGTALDWGVSGMDPVLFSAIMTDSNNDILTFTPVAEAHGSDVITLTLTDSGGSQATQDITIILNSVNDPPVALDDTVTATEDTPLVITAAGLLANDTDLEGDSLSIAGFTQPAFGTVADNQDGTYRYTPEADFNGNDAFGYTVSDGNGGTHAATVSIAVNAVNDPPVAAADAYRVDEDTTDNALEVLANDNDVDANDGMRITAVGAASNGGAVVINGTGDGLLYTPAADFVGEETCNYTIEDASGASAQATVTVKVVNVNTDLKVQKTVNNVTATVSENVVFTITVRNNDANDALGGIVTDILPAGLSYVSDDSGGTYNPNTGKWHIGNILAMPENNIVNLSITAEVIQEGEIINIASLTNSELTDLDSSDNSSGIVLNAGSQADLAIVKMLENPVPNAGDTLTITTTVTNNGFDNATGVQVKEILPSDLTFVLSAASQGSYDADTGLWEVADLNVGAGAMLNLTVMVPNTNEIITAAAIIHSDQLDPDTTNNHSSEVINPDEVNHPYAADLAIQNTVNHSMVNVGDEVVFTLVVRNIGPDDANNVQLIYLMPNGLTIMSSQPSHGAYDEVTGEWDVGAIGAGFYAAIGILAKVTDAGPVAINASIGNLDEFDPDSTNDSDDATVTVRSADLSVVKTLGTAENSILTIQDNVVYTIAVTNHGPDDASGVVVKDILPTGLTYQSSVVSNGNYYSGTGLWDIDGLANGAYAILTITAKIERTGLISNTAVRTASYPADINAWNDTDNITIDVPDDGDNDGMPDEWEVAHGLDPSLNDSNADPDGDLLVNIEEHQIGTDPQNPDEDVDGMPDGWEVAYGLNPFTNDAEDDTDDDGYTNLQEYQSRTQPNNGNSKPEAPVANAGPDQTVGEGVTVTLDASNTTDADDDIQTYLWQQTVGVPVVISDSNAVQPTFAAPDVGPGGALLIFRLTVTDQIGQQDTDTCVVNVTWDNNPPIADAGPDQTVGEAVSVTLDGSGSTDPDDGIQVYFWEQTGGMPVVISDSNAIQPMFAAPDIGFGGESLTFQLTVTDHGGLQDTDTCVVNVTWDNDPPTANAGPDQTVEEAVTVILDGSGSTDPDDGIQDYLWTQTAGIPVTFSDATAVRSSFVTPQVDSNGIVHLDFLLTVIDDGGLAHTDAVSIDVKDNGIIGFPDDVFTTKTTTNENIGIKIEKDENKERSANLISFKTISPDSAPDNANMPDNIIYGLIDMKLKLNQVGDTVRIKIHLGNPAPQGYRWYKFSSNNGWYDYSDHVEFNADRDQVTLTLVDGGWGDDDGIANGMIVDPSGLGSTPQVASFDSNGSTDGGGGGGGGGCFILTLIGD